MGGRDARARGNDRGARGSRRSAARGRRVATSRANVDACRGKDLTRAVAYFPGYPMPRRRRGSAARGTPVGALRAFGLPRALRDCGSAPTRFAALVVGRDGRAVRFGSASTGRGRQRTRSLPICWTGAQPSAPQIRARSESRSGRSSVKTRTLMSSCAVSATSASCRTAGVSPWCPIDTTGCRWWARARSSRRNAGDNGIIRRL